MQPEVAGRRGAVLRGKTHRVRMGCGNVYLTINYGEPPLARGLGLDDKAGEVEGLGDPRRIPAPEVPVEIFSRLGKSGGCQGALHQGIARLVSIALQAGTPPEKIAKTLAGISCPESLPGSADRPASCLDALSRLLAEYETGKGSGG